MEPLSLDADKSIKDTGEYQDGSCNGQGRGDTWVYG